VIQRKIFLDVDYPLAACLATVLVTTVFAFNVASILLLRRNGRAAVR